MKYYVYILTSRKKGTIYIVVTSNLVKRVYEQTNDVNEAIIREKQLKKVEPPVENSFLSGILLLFWAGKCMVKRICILLSYNIS